MQAMSREATSPPCILPACSSPSACSSPPCTLRACWHAGSVQGGEERDERDTGGFKAMGGGDERIKGDEQTKGDERIKGDEQTKGDERIKGDEKTKRDEQTNGDERLKEETRRSPGPRSGPPRP